MSWLRIVPLLLAGLLALHYLGSRAKPPVEGAAVMMMTREPGEDFSGMWADARCTALLRLRHGADDSLSGEYLPQGGDRPVVCKFTGGRVMGERARLDLKINGKRWNCELVKRGRTLTLYGRRDLNALLDQYAGDDRVNGMLIISPRNGQKRREDSLRLAQRRAEIWRAGSQIVEFATFKRVEGRGSDEE